MSPVTLYSVCETQCSTVTWGSPQQHPIETPLSCDLGLRTAPPLECMHSLFFVMLSLQLSYSLHPPPTMFTWVSGLPSAVLFTAPVRSKLGRPLWGTQAVCHVPTLLYILFHRYSAVMLCDLFHWVRESERHSVRENWAVLFLPKEAPVSFPPFIWKLSFSWFYSWKTPLIHWVLDAKSSPIDNAYWQFSVYSASNYHSWLNDTPCGLEWWSRWRSPHCSSPAYWGPCHSGVIYVIRKKTSVCVLRN